jgi:hypothetical protein
VVFNEQNAIVEVSRSSLAMQNISGQILDQDFDGSKGDLHRSSLKILESGITSGGMVDCGPFEIKQLQE